MSQAPQTAPQAEPPISPSQAAANVTENFNFSTNVALEYGLISALTFSGNPINSFCFGACGGFLTVGAYALAKNGLLKTPIGFLQNSRNLLATNLAAFGIAFHLPQLGLAALALSAASTKIFSGFLKKPIISPVFNKIALGTNIALAGLFAGNAVYNHLQDQPLNKPFMQNVREMLYPVPPLEPVTTYSISPTIGNPS